MEVSKKNLGKNYRELMIDLMDHSVNDAKTSSVKLNVTLGKFMNEKNTYESEEIHLQDEYNNKFRIPRETVKAEYQNYIENREELFLRSNRSEAARHELIRYTFSQSRYEEGNNNIYTRYNNPRDYE